MSDLRQLPLFPSNPQSTDELNKLTPLKYTLNLFQKHLKHEGKSDHTIKAFTSDLGLLSDFHGDMTPIGEFTTTNLNAFLHWLEHERGVPCSPKSYARRVTTLKVYFKWLHDAHVIPHDPAKAVLQRSGSAPLSDVLSPDQIRAVIFHSRTMQYRKSEDQDTRPEMLLRLLLDTGIKKSETMKLTLDDIKCDDARAPYLNVSYKVRNVFKERTIALDTEWIKLLDLYIDQYEPKHALFNCTARNLEYILSDIGSGAGLPFRLSFEVLRWTCAVRDYRAGIDEDLIRQKLGLSEISWNETGNKIHKLNERIEAEAKN